MFKRKADARGSYLTSFARGHTEAQDIVLASVPELIKEEAAKYDPVPSATTNATVSIPPNRRGAVRVSTAETGEYLLRYRLAQGEQVLGAGVLPFVIAPPIQMTLTPYHLSPGIISVKADFRKAKQWEKGAKAKFAVVRKLGDKPLSEAAREFADEREFVVALPTRQLDAGGYLVTMEMGGAHGWQVSYMAKTPFIGYDCRYGICLLHNLSPRGSHMIRENLETSYSRSAMSPTPIWAAREWIGPYDKGTELWGYWKNAKFLDTGNPSVKGTFHVRSGEKLLLGMLNIERKPIATTVRLDLKALGFNGKVYAYEPHIQEELPINDGKMDLMFTGEGYRMVMIATKPFDVFKPERNGENMIPEIAPDKWPRQGGEVVPAGWEATQGVGKSPTAKPTAKELRVENGAIVMQGDEQNAVRLHKRLTVEKGKSYVLEAEAYVECDDGVFVEASPDKSFFRIALGEVYDNNRRTIASQGVAGHTEKVRLWFTVKEYANVDLWLTQCKARAIIKKLEVHELKVPPRPRLD
ncbi:MAG: hypothetical protein HY360_22595 [Verrucomicrobia bacterium]|nr:hypothetical protein [Verrucomicrobiota bacterium]